MAKKIVTAVGILWVACSFFLYGGIRSDSLPCERPERLPFTFSPEREKKLLAEAEFIRLFADLPNGLLQKKEEWERFFQILDKTPDSIFLNGILVRSYKNLPDKKEKERISLRLTNLSRKHLRKSILGAIVADILTESGKKKEAYELLGYHLESLQDLQKEEREKYISGKAPGREHLLYMARARARLQLALSQPEAERAEELQRLLKLFPNDLFLLQYLLRAQYEAMEKAEAAKPLLPFIDSPKEKWRKAFHKSCRKYLLQCRKELQNGKSLHIGRFHAGGFFYLERSPWKEERKNLLLEECMPKYPALDFEEMITLASLFEKEKKPLFAAITLLRLLKEESFPCNTLHFLLAEEKLRGFQAGADRIRLYKMALLSDPENLPLALGFVQLLWQEGREKEGWKILKELFPAPRAYMLAAQRMFSRGLWKEADRFLVKAMKGFKHPEKSDAHRELSLFRALVLEKMGRKKELEKLLRDLLKVQKESHEVMNFLGYTLADENRNLPEAESLIRKALAKKENQAYMDSLAWVCYRKKDFANAICHIEKAIALTPTGEEPDSLIYDHAGDIFFAAGKKSKALQYWKKAAGSYSQEYDLVSILEKIRKLEKGK